MYLKRDELSHGGVVVVHTFNHSRGRWNSEFQVSIVPLARSRQPGLHSETLSPKVKKGSCGVENRREDVAQWSSFCLEFARLWVQFPSIKANRIKQLFLASDEWVLVLLTPLLFWP